MSRIVSIYSFRRGTGKSTLIANLAVQLAAQGKRVGVADTDFQSPSLHTLFGLNEDAIRFSLNDFLKGRCDLKQTVHPVNATGGPVFLIPASPKVGDILDVLRHGYDAALFDKALNGAGDKLGLDVLLVDTHSGLNETTLVALAVSDVAAVILRPDQQDYQGTGLLVDVAHKLGVRQVMLLVNEAPPAFDAAGIKLQIEQAYKCEVAAVLPHSDDLMATASTAIFSLRYPAHPLAQAYSQLAIRLAV